MTATDVAMDDRFRHLQIWSGVPVPLIRDAQESILALAVQGKHDRVQAIVQEQEEAGLPYVAWLLNLGPCVPAEAVWDVLRQRRAERIGLAADANLDDVLAAELEKPGCQLRIEDLRRERLGPAGRFVKGPW